MVLEFLLVMGEVGEVACFRAAPLLAAPGNEADGASGAEPILEQQSHGLEAGYEASTVVVGACLRAGVPRVDVAAHQQDLIGFR